ncbi:MAG: transposase [Thermoplasmata archaeon]
MKKAGRRRAVVVFLDESGFSLIPFVGKTWAPVGQTPVLIHQGRWPKFSAISGVPPRGKLFIHVRESTIATPQVIQFLRHQLRHIRRRPIMIFWDGGRPHKSNVGSGSVRSVGGPSATSTPTRSRGARQRSQRDWGSAGGRCSIGGPAKANQLPTSSPATDRIEDQRLRLGRAEL